MKKAVIKDNAFFTRNSFQSEENKMVEVRLEPRGKEITFTKLNTVLQLLNKLELRHTDVLVIRDGELLTQDCRIEKDDKIIVRNVMSVG